MIKPILMVDLFNQYLKIKTEIDTTIQDVINSSVFVKGGKVDDFEQKLSKYLNTNVIACGNGTDALQLSFMALGLQPGDEVITTPFTFIATVEVLALLGLKPVFTDVEPGSFNINTRLIEDKITQKTKAILPVHLYGQNAEMEMILLLAKEYNLFVIEDAAQSLGADYFFNDGRSKKSGTIGDIGCTSFFPSKTLGAFGDGGAVFCNDQELAEKIRSVANHGMVQKYNYRQVGVNSRLDSIQAAILEIKLKYIEQYIESRQQVASFYDEKLKDLPDLKIPERKNYSSHIFHQYTIRCNRRNELKQFLNSRNIPSMVYYPKPLHLQKAYGYLNYTTGDFPESEKLSETVLSLPMHTELDKEQLNFITGSIIEFFKNN